jgi:hypothetical protein
VTLGTTRSQLDAWLPYFLEYSTPEQRERWFPLLPTQSSPCRSLALARSWPGES